MDYDLAALARLTGTKRKTIELRPIDITQALEADIYTIMLKPIRTWTEQVKIHILPAYERAVSQLVQDGPADDVSASFTTAEAAALATLGIAEPEIRAWLLRVVGWHNTQWTARVKAALGVNVYPYVAVEPNQAYIDAMLQRNVSLIRSIGDDLRKDIAETVWREFQTKTLPRKVGAMITARTGIARRRANFIASDQAGKVAAELTMLRQTQAGITRFKWVATMDMRTRPSHAALNGEIFEWDNPPSIGLPGAPPRCRCSAAAVLDLEED